MDGSVSIVLQHPTMFDDAHYRWKHEPDDGEYELQFDRFETSERGDYHDQVVLLIVDEGEGVGDVVLPTADVPGIESEEAGTTAIFYGRVEDSEVVDLTYDPELSEQRHKEAQSRHDRVQSPPDEDSDGS